MERAIKLTQKKTWINLLSSFMKAVWLSRPSRRKVASLPESAHLQKDMGLEPSHNTSHDYQRYL